MDTQMKKSGNGGRAALGFFLTFFMTITLIVNGLVMGVKTTILSGSDVSEVLENMNIYEVLSDLITSEISNSTGTGNEEGDDVSAGEIAIVVTNEDVSVPSDDDGLNGITISDEAIQAIFGEDVLKSVTKTLTDAIKNNEEVDLSSTKEQCIANVENLAMGLIDDVIDEIQAMESDTISADTLKELNTVKQMKADYGIDVDGIITDFVKENHGADTIKLADVDLEEIRTGAKDTVKNDVMPKMEETVNEYVDTINKTVNESIKEANEAYNLSGLINGIESALSILNTTMIVCIVVILLFAALEMLVYKKEINRGFRNIFISTLIGGIFTLVISIVVNTVKSIFSSVMGGEGDTITLAVTKLIESNIGAVGNRIMLIAIVYLVVAIACLVAAIIIKKKLNNDKDVNGMGTLSDGSAIA